jgi:hypothetical protein
VGVTVTGILTFEQNSLVDVSGVFGQSAFTEVRDVFLARYGGPASLGGDHVKWAGKIVDVDLYRVQPKGSRVGVVDTGAERYVRSLDLAL